MSESKIDKMNEAIALFDGWERYEDSYGIWFKKEGMITALHPKLQSLQYHSSWDWLHGAWEKFRDLRFDNPKLAKEHSDWKVPIDNAICYQSIFSTHILLYKAIQWYNKQLSNEAKTSAEQACKGRVMAYRYGYESGHYEGTKPYATKLYQAQQENNGYVAEIESVGTLIKEHEALQAKCERYEKALKDINRRAEYGKPIDLALGTKSGEMCIAIEIISRTALEDGKANEALSGEGDRICPSCSKVFNANRNGCCRECGSDEYQNQKEDKQ